MEPRIHIEIDLTEKELIALGLVIGLGKMMGKEDGPTKGIWETLRNIDDQIRMQLPKHDCVVFDISHLSK